MVPAHGQHRELELPVPKGVRRHPQLPGCKQQPQHKPPVYEQQSNEKSFFPQERQVLIIADLKRGLQRSTSCEHVTRALPAEG